MKINKLQTSCNSLVNLELNIKIDIHYLMLHVTLEANQNTGNTI